MVKIILFIISLFYCVISYAGPWVQEKGHGLNIFTYRRYISTQFWNSSGRLQGSPTYAKNELDEYLEYGVTKKLTMGLYLSGLQSHTAAAGTQTGSYDNLIFGRYLLWKNDWSAFSVQAFVDQLGNAVAFNIPPNNSRFNTGEALLFGTSGKFGSEKTSKGKKHKKITEQYWFADMLIGTIQRYSAGNQLQLNVEAGLKLHDNKIYLLLQNYNTFSIGHPTYPEKSEYNLMTIAPSIVYWVNKAVGVQLGYAQDIFGNNVGKGRSPFLASWIQF